MKKNIYKKFQKKNKRKERYDEKVIVEKSSTLKIVLSFLENLISNIVKIVFYILIVALCSLGATYLFNLILKGGIL